MKSLVCALAIAALESTSVCAHAGSLDLRPAAQAGVEWRYGAAGRSANPLSLRFAMGYDMSRVGDPRDGGSGQDRFRLDARNLLPLVDAQWSTAPGANVLRIAGFSPAPASANAAGNSANDSSWMGRNWGWLAAGGVAVVAAVVAVSAGSGGGGGDNNYSQANQCQVTVVGGTPTNTSNCPKSVAMRH